MSQLVIPNVIGGPRLAKPFNDNYDAIQAWANGNIGQDNLAPSSVGTSELVDGSVVTAKYGDKSITLAKMGDASVDYTKLANQLVGEYTVPGVGSKALTNTSFTKLGSVKLTPASDCHLLIVTQVKSDTGVAGLADGIVFHRLLSDTTVLTEGHTHTQPGWASLANYVTCIAVTHGVKNTEVEISVDAIATKAGDYTVGGTISVYALGRG